MRRSKSSCVVAWGEGKAGRWGEILPESAPSLASAPIASLQPPPECKELSTRHAFFFFFGGIVFGFSKSFFSVFPLLLQRCGEEQEKPTG